MVAAFAVVVGAVLLVLPEQKQPSLRHARTPRTGSISLVDRTWHCRAPVHLDLVRVVIHAVRKDAVHLDRGCTGTIRRLEIVGDGRGLGPAGDGVKIHDGAHDLQILGGVVNCGAKSHGKHQDAIQAMGGTGISFVGIVSRYCSNSFMFVNAGAHRRGLPTGIRCTGCTAQSRNYSIFVGRSRDSGASGGRFRSRVGPHVTAAAVDPFLHRIAWKPRA